MKSAKEVLAISGDNTFTPLILLLKGERLSISISGIFDANVTLQRRLDAANWRNVSVWSGGVETSYISDEVQEVRIGIPTGDYTSGTADCRIGKG